MLSTLVVTAAKVHEAEGEVAVNPYIVGGIALGILLALLLMTIAFGGGREHS